MATERYFNGKHLSRTDNENNTFEVFVSEYEVAEFYMMNANLFSSYLKHTNIKNHRIDVFNFILNGNKVTDVEPFFEKENRLKVLEITNLLKRLIRLKSFI